MSEHFKVEKYGNGIRVTFDSEGEASLYCVIRNANARACCGSPEMVMDLTGIKKLSEAMMESLNLCHHVAPYRVSKEAADGMFFTAKSYFRMESICFENTKSVLDFVKVLRYGLPNTMASNTSTIVSGLAFQLDGMINA